MAEPAVADYLAGLIDDVLIERAVWGPAGAGAGRGRAWPAPATSGIASGCGATTKSWSVISTPRASRWAPRSTVHAADIGERSGPPATCCWTSGSRRRARSRWATKQPSRLRLPTGPIHRGSALGRGARAATDRRDCPAPFPTGDGAQLAGGFAAHRGGVGDMIAIIDYGIGNLRSVEKGLAARGRRRSADRGPGGGAGATASSCRAWARSAPARWGCRSGFQALVLDAAQAGKPLLGICVGMQLLFEQQRGDGQARRAGAVARPGAALPGGSGGCGRPAPQGAADRLEPAVARWHRPAAGRRAGGSFAYFVHSYYCQAGEPADVVATTDYGLDYASIVRSGNLGRAVSPGEEPGGGPADPAQFRRYRS